MREIACKYYSRCLTLAAIRDADDFDCGNCADRSIHPSLFIEDFGKGKDLFCAVILQAMRDALRGVEAMPERIAKERYERLKAARLRDEARRWIRTKTNGDMSFRWYCDWTGIDANSIRKKIRHPKPVVCFTGLAALIGE